MELRRKTSAASLEDAVADRLNKAVQDRAVTDGRHKVLFGMDRSADDFVRQYAQSVTGEDMICREEFPICSKGAGAVCTDQVGIRGHE